MDVYTGIRERIYGFAVLFVAGALLAGYCFEVESTTYTYYSWATTWRKAQEICAENGMILVKINSEQEMTELMTVDTTFGRIISAGESWTGLYTTLASCSGYTWDSGVTATWFKWDTNEPNKCSNSHCVRLRDGLMRTITCSNAYPFICQTQQEETTTTSPIPVTDVSFTDKEVTNTTSTTTEMTTTSPIPVTDAPSTDKEVTNTTSTTTEMTTTSPIPVTDVSSTDKEVTNTTSTTTEMTTTSPIPVTDVSSTDKEVTNTTSTTTEMTTTSPIPVTDVSSTDKEVTSTATTTAERTNASSTEDSLLMELTSTPCTLGTMICLCDGKSQNSTRRFRGIIPSSIAHHKSLLTAGYTPACQRSNVWGNGSTLLNREEKLALLNVLKKQLNVAKSTTSLYRRKLVSVHDNRSSATSVGAVGICLLVGLFGTVVAIDASRLYTYCKNRSKIKTGSS